MDIDITPLVSSKKPIRIDNIVELIETYLTNKLIIIVNTIKLPRIIKEVFIALTIDNLKH